MEATKRGAFIGLWVVLLIAYFIGLYNYAGKIRELRGDVQILNEQVQALTDSQVKIADRLLEVARLQSALATSQRESLEQELGIFETLGK